MLLRREDKAAGEQGAERLPGVLDVLLERGAPRLDTANSYVREVTPQPGRVGTDDVCTGSGTID